MTETMDFGRGILPGGDDSRIVSCMCRALAGEPVTVAFLGGSITQGSLSSTPQLCYAYRTYDWWKKSFPASEITYLNAGIGGTTSHLGVGRVEEEVLSHRPDFVIVEFSVNDEDNDPHFQETYESLVRRILSDEKRPALMLVHNVRYDDGGNAEPIHRPVGEYYHIPSVAIRPVVYAKIEEGSLDRRRITPDDLHPNDLGHELVAGVITRYLEAVREQALAKQALSEKEDKSRQNQEPGSEDQDLSDAFLPLPAPLTKSAYERAVRYRNDAISSVFCEGFQPDQTPQSAVSDCFKKGWTASEVGSRIVFEVQGSCIAVQYRKTVRKPAPIATLTLDGDRARSVKLDANFTETWGDCLYLETVLEHGTDQKHTVEIEITQTQENDQECFYLVSLIVA